MLHAPDAIGSRRGVIQVKLGGWVGLELTAYNSKRSIDYFVPASVDPATKIQRGGVVRLSVASR